MPMWLLFSVLFAVLVIVFIVNPRAMTKGVKSPYTVIAMFVINLACLVLSLLNLADSLGWRL